MRTGGRKSMQIIQEQEGGGSGFKTEGICLGGREEENVLSRKNYL